MNLLRALGPKGRTMEKALITIVGAGGKTGTMFALARELRDRGERVLLTTTTAIYRPAAGSVDHIYTGDDQGFREFLAREEGRESSGRIVVWGSKVDTNKKLRGVSPEDIDGLWKDGTFSWILVEGDGAKRKSIKAPDQREPVIPRQSTVVIGVMGMSVLGKAAEEHRVHRLPIFSEITGIAPGEAIGEAGLRRLVLDPRGLFNGKPPGATGLLLLNQCEDQQIRTRALALGKSLPMPFIIASLRNKALYYYRLGTGEIIVGTEGINQ